MRVKICGLTRLEDARIAADLGAFAVGFIFYPESPRYIAPDEVRKIVDQLPKAIEKVGVFVNASCEVMRDIARGAGLTRVQLHGDESPALCEGIGVPVIKVLRLNGETERATKYRVAGFLIDAVAPAGVWGGTGARADWKLAADFFAAERPQGRELWLGGGLTPENAAEAVRTVQPDGIDVSSGVESSPGIKDERKLRALFAAMERSGK